MATRAPMFVLNRGWPLVAVRQNVNVFLYLSLQRLLFVTEKNLLGIVYEARRKLFTTL